MTDPAFHKRDPLRGKSLHDYWPLVALILVSIMAAFALNYPVRLGFGVWMHFLMGYFLTVFALLKIFHIPAFVNGFVMYDIIAKRVRIYAFLYPYIELALGLAYLAFLWPEAVYIATIILSVIGSIGVFAALRRGLDINCPCMGSILDVPLSTVTLTEDIGMGLMALVMLFTAA